LLVFLINFMLVMIQPIWLQFFISIDYLNYILGECILALPLVFMLLIISYMHCIIIMQIQDGENRYKNILKLATESIIIYDNNHGFIVDINPSFQNCFGYTLDECKELIVEDFLTFKKRDMHEHLDSSLEDVDYSAYQRREVLKTGTWTKCMGITKNGTRFPAEVIFKQSDYNGRDVDVYVIRDLRDRKEMKKHYKAAEHARVELQRRTNFFAMVSHDLKTPLNSIYLIAQKLLERCDTKDIELVNMIVDSCQILSNIIKDVLFSTRLDAGSLSLDISRFNLRKSIEKIVCISGITALRKGLDVAVEFDTRIASLKIPQYVYGDPGKFQQILTNLLGNAIKFTRIGSIIIRIEVKELTSNAIKVYISVKDTGIGIPQDKQPLLFQMFARVHEDKKIEGTGLGLAICKNLCKLMKGDIGFQSNIGEGSEFWFTAVFNTQNPKRSPSSGSKLVSTNEVKVSVPHNTEYLVRHRSAIPTIEISDLPLTVESFDDDDDDDDSISLKENGNQDEEDSSSLLSEDTAYYILNDFYSIDIKKTAALIIYKNEQVRASLQQYFENFGIRTICVAQCDSFFLNKETVTSQLNLTLYNASIPSKNRNEWSTILPISLVIIDDNLLLNPEMGLETRRTSVISLFENNAPPPSMRKKDSISDTGRKINLKDMERILKVVNRLKFLILSHNIRCNGESIHEDLVYYCCLYHTFDIERMKEFCNNPSNGNTLDGNFDNCFLHGYLRKPLCLTTIIKIIDGMLGRHEQFNRKYTEQMEKFKQNKTKYIDQEEQFNSDISTQLSNYQFPPPKSNTMVRISRANYSPEPPLRASYMKQRRSESCFISKYQMNPNNITSFRKYSDPSVPLHESLIRAEDKIKEMYAKLYPVENSEALLKPLVLDRKQHSEDLSMAVNDVVLPQVNAFESMQPKENSFRSLILSTLVADDNDINRKVMVRILQDCSLKANDYNTSSIMKQYYLNSVQVDCISVSDGQDVIDNFKHRISNSKDTLSGPILDLIFLDVHMKDVNGIECARTIRRLERENHIINSVIIVGITGDTQIEKQCLAAGMNRVVLKPFKQDQLRQLIEEAIQRKSKGTN
jgi:PAS domain S-box-containing protein